MALLDWLIVAAFLLLVLGGGMWFSRRASGSMENFFLSGRNLPWWLAGTSILATSFASDTPLHTTKLIREEGLGGAWFYWVGILTHIVVTFFFARMWRRTGVLTDAEFNELRYTGRPAAVLRGTMGAVRGLFLEALTLSWVTLGMVKVVGIVLGLPDTVTFLGWTLPADAALVSVLLVLVLGYSVTAGLWGVVVTDFLEFFVALIGAVLLAVFAWDQVGGAEGLREGLRASSPMGEGALDFFPSNVNKTGLVLAVYLGITWWASDAIDGSGKRAQRFLACRTEKDALASGIWNVAVQWIIRSWPWYVVALASLVLYQDMADHEAVYPQMMADLMPIGLKGLMVAGFLAAFMSTVDTHLNLSSAYVVNDLYKRFMAPDRSAEHYVKVARITLISLALVVAFVALQLGSILDALKFKMELIGGLGGVIVMRWFWWRVNAWSELTAVFCSLSLGIGLRFTELNQPGMYYFAIRMMIIVGVTTTAWIAVTLLTRPEPKEHLQAFFRLVGPPRLGWGAVGRETKDAPPSFGTIVLWHSFLCGVFVFGGMFGLGYLILGPTMKGVVLIAISGVSCAMLIRSAFFSEPASET